MEEELKKEKLKMPLFIIDSSVLSKMIAKSNDDKAIDVLLKIGEMNIAGIPFKALTPLSSLLNAIWKTDGDAKLEVLHNVLDIVDVVPDKCDYKNDKEVMDNILKIANAISG